MNAREATETAVRWWIDTQYGTFKPQALFDEFMRFAVDGVGNACVRREWIGGIAPKCADLMGPEFRADASGIIRRVS